jgi:hypothetical protein
VDTTELSQIVADLIEVMHLQSKEIEKLVSHVEQVTGHLSYRHQFSLVASELSDLHQRIQNLRAKLSSG